MTAMDSAIMIVWLRPSSSSLRASGSRAVSSRCRAVAPSEATASMHAGVGAAQSERGEPGHRRRRVDDGGEDRGRARRCRRPARRAAGTRRPGSTCMVSRTGRRTRYVRSESPAASPSSRPSTTDDERPRRSSGRASAWSAPTCRAARRRGSASPAVSARRQPRRRPARRRSAATAVTPGPAEGEQRQVDAAHGEDDGVADVAEEVEEQRVAVAVVDDPVVGLAERVR